MQRQFHRYRDARPWILDDALAQLLYPIPTHRFEAAELPPMWSRARAFVVGRQRYCEDRLGSFGQYVILGAGLDSFAWRRPEALADVHVFEIDRPRLQAWKRERIAEIGLSGCAPTFVPIDFETQTLDEALDASGFDWSVPTLFSCLGVVMYLTPAAIEATLSCVAHCAPISEIVLTYNPARELLDAATLQFREQQAFTVGAEGEPYLSEFAPASIEALVRRCGLETIAHPTSADLRALYFTGRSDGLRPYDGERLLVAQSFEEATAAFSRRVSLHAAATEQRKVLVISPCAASS